jgi:hypothetical protein
MTPETIKVTITYNSPITFHLEMVGITEENEIRQKFIALTDEEKSAGKEYELNVQVLADLSNQLPDCLFPEGIIPKGLTPDVIKNYFAAKTGFRERIAEYAVRGYLARLVPDISFQ